MAATKLAKLSAPTTAEVCTRFPLGDEARGLLAASRPEAQPAPGAFLDTLLARELLVDAMRFLACALPKREAVWWACRCVRAVSGADAELAAVAAAEAWVRDPSEANRRAAMAAAQKLEFRSPEAWAAVGAFWAEGSLAPPDAPVVPPGDELVGHAVAGAVLLAAVQQEPEKAAEKQRRFAALAVEVANAAGSPGGAAGSAT